MLLVLGVVVLKFVQISQRELTEFCFGRLFLFKKLLYLSLVFIKICVKLDRLILEGQVCKEAIDELSMFLFFLILLIF